MSLVTAPVSRSSFFLLLRFFNMFWTPTKTEIINLNEEMAVTEQILGYTDVGIFFIQAINSSKIIVHAKGLSK